MNRPQVAYFLSGEWPTFRPARPGLEWLANNGYFAALSTGGHGDAQGLVALALLEKRQNADQNSIGQGYALANATDQARIQAVIGGIIASSGHSFFSYVNGQEMMALSLYLRTGGPDQAAALAALNSVFDASMNVGAYGGACVDDGWGGCQAGGAWAPWGRIPPPGTVTGATPTRVAGTPRPRSS